MNANIFLILMLVLVGIVGIVMSLLCTSKKTEKMVWSIFISFGLFSAIGISFMSISVIQLYKAKNIKNALPVEVIIDNNKLHYVYTYNQPVLYDIRFVSNLFINIFDKINKLY